MFLPPRSFSSNFACRPSPPYIAISVCRFRSRRLAKLCGGELHHQHKALQRKDKNQFQQPQERVSGANAAPIRYPSAENRRKFFSFKRGYLRGYPLDALLVTFLAREKSPVGDRTRHRHSGERVSVSAQDNPSGFASLNHLPLHRGGLGWYGNLR